MKKFIYLAVLLVVLTVTNGEKIAPEPVPSTSTEVPVPTTTPPPPSTSITPTTPPSTTIAPATTSKVPVTTTAPPPTTSTPVPTTNAPPVPTTSKPTPKPKPEVNTWSLNYTDSNKTCIIMKMALHLEIPYETVDNKTATANVILPKTATAMGYCGPLDKNGTTKQNITLSWNEAKDMITFVFDKNETSKQFMISSITAFITPDTDNFPNMTGNNSITAEIQKEKFITPMSMSYRCAKEETLNLQIEDNVNKTAKFIVKDLQLQAFHDTAGTDFSSAEDCESSETPGIVPIAVGCSLAALILVVLIAYLVGRRRSQARGYLSM